MIILSMAIALATPAPQARQAATLVGRMIVVMDDPTGAGMRQVPIETLKGPFYVVEGDPSGTLVQVQAADRRFWTMATSIIRGTTIVPPPVLSPCRKDQVGATRGSCGSAKPQ